MRLIIVKFKGLTEPEYGHDEHDTAREKTEENSVVRVSVVNLLVGHEGHECCRSYRDVFTAAKHSVDEAAKERGVQAKL